MDERWKVTVDRDVCVGSGVCAAAAREHFRLEEGKSRPINDVIDPDEVALDAAGTCPSEAIAVYDAAGRQLAP